MDATLRSSRNLQRFPTKSNSLDELREQIIAVEVEKENRDGLLTSFVEIQRGEVFLVTDGCTYNIFMPNCPIGVNCFHVVFSSELGNPFSSKMIVPVTLD